MRLARNLPGIIHPRKDMIMTNVWDIILRTARDPELDAGLLEETRRLMRLVSLNDRHADVARSMSNVVSKKGTWEEVSTELCGSIHAALVALATLQEDPEKFFSDYLRPHPDGKAWTWPHFTEAAADAPHPAADKLPQRIPATGFFMPAPAASFPASSPPPAAAEPTGEPTEPDPAPAAFQPSPVPEHVDPIMLDRFAGPFPPLAPPEYQPGYQPLTGTFGPAAPATEPIPPVAYTPGNPFWPTPPACEGQKAIGPLLPLPVTGTVRPLQELSPGVRFAPIDPAHTDRDSA